MLLPCHCCGAGMGPHMSQMAESSGRRSLREMAGTLAHQCWS